MVVASRPLGPTGPTSGYPGVILLCPGTDRSVNTELTTSL